MAKSCPACTSPNRGEIERRLKAKESVRSISRWLLDTFQETIPFSTLFKHSNVHMTQAESFAEKLLSIPKIKLALVPPPNAETIPTDSALPPLEALAKVQNIALEIADGLRDAMKTRGISSQEVSLFTGVLKEARQSAKNRHELVFGRKYVVQHEAPRNPQLKEAPTDDIKKRLAELKAKEKGHV